VVEPFRESHVQLQNGYSEGDDRGGMPEGVGHPELQSASPIALNGCNVTDCGEVIVIEAVAQP
jgi:hypothetical protein